MANLLYDIDAEKSLISSIFIGGNEIFSKISQIQPDFFYDLGCRLVFESFINISKKGENIDVIGVSDDLKQNGHFEKIGGVGFLADITNSLGSSINYKKYASIVIEKYTRRSLLANLKVAENLATNGKFDDLVAKINDIKVDRFTVAETPTAVEVFKDFFSKKMEQKENGQRFTGIKTGFKKLDVMTGGLQDGDYILIGARPSMGKTALLCDIARNVAKLQDVDVYIFSLEMSKDAIISRFASREFKIDNQKWKTPKLLSDQDILSIENGADDFEDIFKNIFIIDSPNMTIPEIYNTILEITSKRGRRPGLICIDYLQRIWGAGNNTVNIYSNISRELKTIARDMNCPLICLSQLSRQCEQRGDKRPMLSDIRESGAIEQDADIVGFLYRDDYYYPDSEKRDMAELIIQKHRNGELGTIDLYFKKEYTTFYNPEMKQFS